MDLASEEAWAEEGRAMMHCYGRINVPVNDARIVILRAPIEMSTVEELDQIRAGGQG